MRFNTMAWFGLGFVVTLAGMGGFEFATAGSRARDVQGAHPGAYVVAESYYGNARVTGAVRQTSLGPQVQLPGGSWVYCRTSCADTLRVEAVDFWQSREHNGTRRDGGFLNLNFTRRW